DFINEVDVIKPGARQRFHLGHHRRHRTVPELVAKQRLVAEAARPRTPAAGLNLGPATRAVKDMVAMLAQREWITAEVELRRPAQLGLIVPGVDMHHAVLAPGTT